MNPVDAIGLVVLAAACLAAALTGIWWHRT
jgi:hypothetical protein